jgi:hypothetical protein
MAVGVVLAAVALVVGAAVIARPQRGVLLLAALVPFNGVLLVVPVGGAAKGWKEALVALTVGAAAIDRSRRPTIERAVPSWFAPVVGLVVIAVASVVVANRAAAVVGAKVTFFYLLVALALWWCPLGRRDRDRLVSILMVTGTVAAVVGLAQQVIGPDRLHELGFEWNTALRTSGGRFRSISTFAQPFPFAYFVMLVLLVGGAVALDDPRRRRNRLFLAVTPVLVAGMLTAVVRGAVLGLVAGLLYLGWSRYRALFHVGVLTGVLTIVVLGAGGSPAFTSSSSLGERQAGWVSTAGLIVTRPLGWGLGTVGAAAEKAFPEVDDATPSFGLPRSLLPYQPDSQYVAIGLQVGPAGLWCFVLVLRGAFRDARVAAAAGLRDGRGFAAGVAAMVVAAATAGIVSTYWEIFPLDVYFWLLLGVLPSVVRASPSTPSPSVPEAAVCRPTSASSSAGSPSAHRPS